MKNTEIILTLKGGIIQSIVSNVPNVTINIVDYDCESSEITFPDKVIENSLDFDEELEILKKEITN